MCPIDFEVKRSKVKVTKHKLLKMVSFLEKLSPRGVFVPLGQPRSSFILTLLNIIIMALTLVLLMTLLLILLSEYFKAK